MINFENWNAKIILNTSKVHNMYLIHLVSLDVKILLFHKKIARSNDEKVKLSPYSLLYYHCFHCEQINVLTAIYSLWCDVFECSQINDIL